MLSPLDRPQAEKALHRLEIAVRMQQRMPALDAERADDHVDRGSYGHSAATKKAVIGGGPDGEISGAERHDCEFSKRCFDFFRFGLGPATLQDLTQNEITYQHFRLPSHQGAKSFNAIAGDAAQVVDPY